MMNWYVECIAIGVWLTCVLDYREEMCIRLDITARKRGPGQRLEMSIYIQEIKLRKM
jgi:hypothetical protein